MRHIRAWFSDRNAPYALFALAFVAHLTVFYALLYLYGPCSFFLSNDCTVNGNDTQHYSIIAYNLTHGNGYSRFVDAPFEKDALRTPLLPLYFAPFTYVGEYSLIWLAILLLNLVLPFAAPLAYKIARYFVPHAHALFVGLVVVFEPLFLYRSQIAEPDALLVLLVLASLFFLIRWWYRGFAPDLYRTAFFLGLGILAKPSALYLAILILLFEFIHQVFFRSGAYLEKAKSFAFALAIVCAMVSPWVMRNTYVFGEAAISSIQGYNLYEYYTNGIKLPDEHIPTEIEKGSREPSRHLSFQEYFISTSLDRIRAHPFIYFKEQAVGSLRNLFVSDISQIHYYGHDRLLPFAYHPESRVNIHELLLTGNIAGTLRALLDGHVLPKVAWIILLGVLYGFASMGWVFSFIKDSRMFLSFTLFACLYGYLIVASGPFVDAKYRLPALALVVIVASYGVGELTGRFLRIVRK